MTRYVALPLFLLLTVGGPPGNPPIVGRNTSIHETMADPLAQAVIDACADAALDELNGPLLLSGLFPDGLDIRSWLLDPQTRPDPVALAEAVLLIHDEAPSSALDSIKQRRAALRRSPPAYRPIPDCHAFPRLRKRHHNPYVLWIDQTIHHAARSACHHILGNGVRLVVQLGNRGTGQTLEFP